MSDTANKDLIGKIENILFAAGDSVAIDDLATYFDMPTDDMAELIASEAERRDVEDNGLVFKLFPGRVQLCTRPELNELIFGILGKKSAEELSKAMLETLSIIAYKQPVTRPELEELRGVNSSYIVSVLESKGLIAEAGQKDTVGKPMTYVTTEKFLRHFGLNSLDELPPLPEEDVQKETGLLSCDPALADGTDEA